MLVMAHNLALCFTIIEASTKFRLYSYPGEKCDNVPQSADVQPFKRKVGVTQLRLQ